MKKLMLLVIALAAVVAASGSAPAAAIGCKLICDPNVPNCCVFCCTNQQCAFPDCSPQ